MRYAPILFDLDGTVVDSGAIILASLRHATQTVLGQTIPDERLLATVGGSGLASQMRDFDPVLASLHDVAIQRAEDPYRGVWTFLLGRSALSQGRVAEAIPVLREAAALLRLRDPGMILPWCLASLVQALGASDDARGAGAVFDELEAVRFRVPFGALDLATVDDFTRWVHDRIRAGAPDEASAAVILDLGDVEFLMAAGVQALVDLDAELAAVGRTLAVAEAAQIVVRVLDICGYADRWIVT